MFKYNILIDDNDYIEFNKFVSFEAPMSKKTRRNSRIFLSVAMALLALILMAFDGFSYYSWGTAFIFGLGIVLFNIIVGPFSKLIIKLNVKSFSKSQKKPYTPKCVMEFNEDSFFEITDDTKTESTYSALECISVVKDKYIYLHIDRLRAYIVPFAAFESADEAKTFLNFLETKAEVKYYN